MVMIIATLQVPQCQAIKIDRCPILVLLIDVLPHPNVLSYKPLDAGRIIVKSTKSKTVNTEGNIQLANHLKRLRTQIGFSKSKLGGLLGVSHTVITQVENHGRRLNLVELCAYCQALNANPRDALQVVIDSELDVKSQN